MRLVATLLLAGFTACSSSGSHDDDSKYVEIHTTNGAVYYALRKEAEKVNEYGFIAFEDQITHRQVRLRSSDCEVRGVSRSTVRNRRIDAVMYPNPSPVGR